MRERVSSVNFRIFPAQTRCLKKRRKVNVPAGFREKKNEAFDRIMGSVFGAIFQSTSDDSLCLEHSVKRGLEWNREDWIHRGHGCARSVALVSHSLLGIHTPWWSLIRGRELASGRRMSSKARRKPLKNDPATKRHAFLAAKALDRDERDEGSISS